jgi:hypothetical protein
MTVTSIAAYRARRGIVAAEDAVPPACDHPHDTTTRYDQVRRVLTFLLFCPVCGTERVVHTQSYEPRPRWGDATVHALPARPADRAA